jgi:hypothetical protein
MTLTRGRTAFATLITAAALVGAGAPAQAAHHPDRCERKLERIEKEFRILERFFGWEAASWWWNEIAWPKYYRQCEA